MPMYSSKAAVAACILVMLLSSGCDRSKERIQEMSTAKHHLAGLVTVWKNAQASFKTPQPNLNFLRIMNMQIDRTTRAVARDCSGETKAKLEEKLQRLADTLGKQVLPLVDLEPIQVVPRPGVTIEQVKLAFSAVDPICAEIEAMSN